MIKLSNSLYKYFSADVFHYVFEGKNSIKLKCSMPKDYNDPYELFLGIDLGADRECLSTYKASLGEIPQYYTTCFSSSGSSNHMWAHYAKNHSGFVVEFSAEELKNLLPDSHIKAVTYRDTPDESILTHLQRATATGKARHTMWMMDAMIHHAYFTKQSCWSYEQEQRLVGINGDVNDSILSISNSCVLSIISGKNATEEFNEIVLQQAKDTGKEYYKSHIGKSYPTNFFRTARGVSYVENGGHIYPSPYNCEACNEPTIEPRGKCVWCEITEADLTNASSRNMLSAIDRMGGLEDYIRQFRAIGKKGP